MQRRKMLMVSALAVTVAAGFPLSASASPSATPPAGSAAALVAPSTSTGTGGQVSPEMANLQLQIDQLNAQMLAAADSANQAVGQASVAKEAAAKAKAVLDAATVEAEAAQVNSNEVAADLYKQGPLSMSQATILSSNGPQDFIDKLVLTDQVGEYQVTNINVMVAAQKKQQAANIAAEAAASDAQAKADEAQKVSSESQAKLAVAQQQMDELKAKANVQPEAAAPAPAADVVAVASPAAAPGQVNGAWALPASGTFTSAFAARWGTFHQGIDIANAIGTPIYAAGNGVVLRAGPATGFGLAVYIQHPTGEVTVYGHVNEIFVQAGQSVQAGQHIADMGNRGYSTGPHLHFEVQTSAYGTRVDPQGWLASHGISVG